ncbi:MAG: DUF5686 and carboxypeptidase regulatory-like domain-containing protein [Cytophagales bacterium]|nr:DUF5686 and carboxypeptidase regulatory-like domain-containing protein [Cytophagales bacterium]
MKITFFLLLLFTASLSQATFGQGVEGTVSDENGIRLPFVSVYTEGNLQGTTSNSQGEFRLRLPEGEHKVIFQYMGYTTKVHPVLVSSEFQTLNVKLEEKIIQLKQVEISGSQEDPAYSIMRKAIGMREYYLWQVQEYRAKAYVKGSGKLNKVPKAYQWAMGKEARKEVKKYMNKTLVTETIANVSFQQPNKFTHNVLAAKNNFDSEMPNPLNMIMGSLYDAEMNEVLSPLAPNAFAHYRFSYEGFFVDQGREVNIIKVRPRRKGEGLYTGTLHIAERFWNIHSADLSFTHRIGKISMRQTYAPAGGEVWMPATFSIRASFDFMGVKAEMNYAVSVSEYDIMLNPKLDHSLIRNAAAISKKVSAEKENVKSRPATKRQKEIDRLLHKEKLSNSEMRKLNRKMKREAKAASTREELEIKSSERTHIDSLAHKRDTSYWKAMRSIPLTPEESTGYRRFDSIQVLHTARRNSQAKLTKKKKNTVQKISDISNALFFGKKFGKTRFFNWKGISAQYNTVDGLTLGGKFRLGHSDKKKHGKDSFLDFEGLYAFGRHKWMYSAKLGKNYAPMSRGQLLLSAGSRSADFNSTSGINPTINSLWTLFFEENLLKLYGKDFAKAENSIDLANGLRLKASAAFSHRYWLENTSGAHWINWKNNELTGNEPYNREVPTTRFTTHNAAVTELTLSYNHRQRYYVHKGAKIPVRYSQYPTLTLCYKKGWKNIFNSKTDYDFASFSIANRTKINFQHDWEYQASAGKFFNRSGVFFPDFHHFNNSQLPVYAGDTFGKFRLMDLYEQSTQEEFAQFSVAFYSKRLLLKRLPWFNQQFFLERFFVNYLYTPALGNYTELGYGLDNILNILSVELSTGFIGDQYQGLALRFGLRFHE